MNYYYPSLATELRVHRPCKTCVSGTMKSGLGVFLVFLLTVTHSAGIAVHVSWKEEHY